MTLSSQLEALKALSAKKKRAQQSLSDRRAFQTRVTELETTLDGWKPLSTIYGEFKARRICDDVNVQYAEICLSQLRSLKEGVSGGKYGSEEGDPPTLKLFKEFEPKFLKRLDSSLCGHWRKHLKNLEQEAIGDRFLEEYDYGDYSTLVIQLRTLLSQLQAAGNRLPGMKPTKGGVEAFEIASLKSDCSAVTDLAESIRTGVMGLPKDRLPDDVKAFLARAKSSEGAPLSLLTEQVLEWLKEHGADGRFQVRTKS